jgi:pimeloyl-ACP methyl ester carboxylesterase
MSQGWTKLRTELAHREKSGPIAWREAGKGPPVLLLHCVGLNADAFEPQIAELKQRRWVVAADLPGHGQSDRLPDGATLEDFVAAIARLIEDLGSPPLPVIGHSLGALIALGLALDYPEKVSAVVALNCVYCRAPLEHGAVEARAKQLSTGKVDVSGPIARWFPDDPQGPLAVHIAKWLRQVDPRGYAAAYRIFASADRAYQGRLNKIACPALFVTGVSDPNSTPAMSDRMAHEVQHGRSFAIPGGRHMMHLTHAVETNNAIVAFLNSMKSKW